MLRRSTQKSTRSAFDAIFTPCPHWLRAAKPPALARRWCDQLRTSVTEFPDPFGSPKSAWGYLTVIRVRTRQNIAPRKGQYIRYIADLDRISTYSSGRAHMNRYNNVPLQHIRLIVQYHKAYILYSHPGANGPLCETTQTLYNRPMINQNAGPFKTYSTLSSPLL